MVNLGNFLLELAKPSGLWPKIFDWFASFAGNYGWTVVLFTIAVKLLVSPLDFYNRYSTRKNTLIQKRLAGQVQKINYKYQNNTTYHDLFLFHLIFYFSLFFHV